MKLLLAEDDTDLAGLLTFSLGRAGFEVLSAPDLPTAIHLFREWQPDVAVLDVTLGEGSGFDLLQFIRAQSGIPVLMLTGHTAEDDKVRALNLGADDYITKPFSHRELVARIQAQVRRHGRQRADASVDSVAERGSSEPDSAQSAAAGRPAANDGPGVLRTGPLTLDTRQHAVYKKGRPVRLSGTQFRLLRLFMERAGTVLSPEEILRRVWGDDDPGGTGLVYVAIFRLRRKLEDDPSNPRLLHTVPGGGFVLRPASGDATNSAA